MINFTGIFSIDIQLAITQVLEHNFRIHLGFRILDICPFIIIIQNCVILHIF